MNDGYARSEIRVCSNDYRCKKKVIQKTSKKKMEKAGGWRGKTFVQNKKNLSAMRDAGFQYRVNQPDEQSNGKPES